MLQLRALCQRTLLSSPSTCSFLSSSSFTSPVFLATSTPAHPFQPTTTTTTTTARPFHPTTTTTATTALHQRTFATWNKAAGHRNTGRTIQNRVVAPEKWHHIDARGKIVGRLATEIATLLTGKHKPTYLPNIDSGDHVVVTNARHIVFTGAKVDDKYYRWHTGFPGGLKQKSVKETLDTKPDDVLRRAVNGMLPKNRLRKLRMRKFRTFADEEHPHEAQLNGKLRGSK